MVSLAVLGDDRRGWKPSQFGYQLWGTKIDFNFQVVKLLDYAERWSDLEASRNPFATIVMAHLKAQDTREERQERKKWKLTLIRRLYSLGYSREDVINLFHFIDWVMSLPAELEQEFWQEIQLMEEERRMPYITSVERSRKFTRTPPTLHRFRHIFSAIHRRDEYKCVFARWFGVRDE